MKAWEETWEAGKDYDSVLIQGAEEDRLDMRYGRGDAMGRCRLAAAAPEMARMLLRLLRLEGDETRWLLSYADRDLVEAVLRKAGVPSPSEDT